MTNTIQMPEQATTAVIAQYAELYEQVKSLISPLEWEMKLPYIAEINRLKREKNAVILAHNYQIPEIFHAVADITGDSLALAKLAAETDADTIILCGVHFMAETAKIVCPEKRVLIPDLRAGCSLADSIRPEDIRALRKKYPGVPVVTYVNTSAAVKAETDVCCTSANAVAVVESLGTDRVIFLPDEFLGKYVASQTNVEIILWDGHCEVHERFTAQELRNYRNQQPDIHIVAHPECPPDVLDEADFVGSTAGMIAHLHNKQPHKVVMVTECSMSDNVSVEFPNIEFTRPCNLCPHMKRISLENIWACLQHDQYEVTVRPEIAARAKLAVDRMLNVGRKEAA